MDGFGYYINNGSKVLFYQNEFDRAIKVCTYDENGELERKETIPVVDMVMLLNLYRCVKENDIQNDFINPNGKNREVI